MIQREEATDTQSALTELYSDFFEDPNKSWLWSDGVESDQLLRAGGQFSNKARSAGVLCGGKKKAWLA